jgi:cellulose synthase/poly-beta-1,6-N-acetylglucosamine synthase-like glycosyltransferase
MDCSHRLSTAGRYLQYGFIGALMLTALPARAASVSFFLDQSNALPDGTSYLSVMLTESVSGGVDFLVQTLDSLNSIAGQNFGIQKFGFNFLDGSWGEISNLSDDWRIMSNKSMDGFGKFDVRLQGQGNSRTDSLGFTVNGASLGDFDSFFSAHVAGFEWCRTDERLYSWCGDRFCTTSAYFAGQSLPPPDPSAVPIPAAVWLFGSGLIGLVAATRRKQLQGTSLAARYNTTSFLFGYAVLLAVTLVSPPVVASSFAGLGESSRGGFAIDASTFSTDWSKVTGFELADLTSRGGFAIDASTFSTDWSKVTGFELASRTSVESLGASMEFGINTLVWLAAVLISVPMLLVILEAIMAVGFRKRKPMAAPVKEFPRTVVLIPAHNEADVISRCLASLSVDLPPNCRLVCVAHNCTDATAEIARNLGAEVVEVQDAGHGGKPDALKAGLQSLDANPPDVVVIVDADCVVSQGAVRMLATRARELNRPVMGAYFFAPADAEKGMATLSSLAVLFKNFVRPLGLQSLGLPCLLNGSGSAYPFQVIRKAPQGKGAIAEDYQLAIDLLERGYPTTFVPEARVDGLLPKREDTALRQRRRWEHGHMFLAFRTAPRLMFEGLKRLDKNRLGLALEVSVPPLAFLGLMWAIAVSLSLALYVFYGHGGPLGFLAGTAVMFAAAVLMSWMRFAGVKSTLAALASVPGYLMWKLPLYREFFTHRETRWMKTARDGVSGAQPGLRAPFPG